MNKLAKRVLYFVIAAYIVVLIGFSFPNYDGKSHIGRQVLSFYKTVREYYLNPFPGVMVDLGNIRRHFKFCMNVVGKDQEGQDIEIYRSKTFCNRKYILKTHRLDLVTARFFFFLESVGKTGAGARKRFWAARRFRGFMQQFCRMGRQKKGQVMTQVTVKTETSYFYHNNYSQRTVTEKEYVHQCKNG